MAFNTATFSTSGLNLLAQLSSTKSLRIKHIYIDETEHTSSDFNQPPSWWASQTSTTMAKVDAELSAASVISDQARLIVKLSLKQDQTTTVTAKTIVITACGVESGTESNEVTFCGVSDTTGIEAIYNASGVKVSTSVAVYFAFNNASSITFADNINPDFVIHSELDRFVSCHSIGDPTGGEAQTVGGIKTFKDGAVINIADSNTLSFQYDGSEQGWIGDTGSTGLQFTSTGVIPGDTCFRFSDNGMDIVNISLAAGTTSSYYLFDVAGDVTAKSLKTEYTQGNTKYTVTQQGGKIRLVQDDGTAETVDLGFTHNNNFGIILDNAPRFEVTDTEIDVNGNLVISDTAEMLGLTFTEDHAPGTIRMEHSENTGTRMTFGVGDSIDSPNRSISLSIYRDTIHTHRPLIAESGLQVSGMIRADAFYGDLWGCIPEPLNEWDCKRGTLCVIKATTVGDTVAYNSLLRGDRIVKVDAQGKWSKVGSSQTFQIALASFDGTVANTAPNLAIGDRFAIITSGGNNGTYLAMRIQEITNHFQQSEQHNRREREYND